ncbi:MULTISPECIES: glycoside hydrolase family 130 protein [unclassified Leifsonia]|uniref:glycoside hydrolase family 130 protein n=1 Tax=unclassified Leifsonia TaxID=2663824 RepID=UPI000A19A883|nr:MULTISPECIES: glycosidase [unclassified Leifsonia]QJA00393.1 glycosidase [Leifsonia sp. PS1209]
MSTTVPAVSTAVTVPYVLERAGVVMEPDPADPRQVDGVLNPATVQDPDGTVHLFPRLVAEHNVSSIGRARVVVTDGVPTAVDGLEVALEADRGWEHGTGHGGVEDPRITPLKDLGIHVMSYVAFGPLGPKPALAVSTDGVTWRRLGPIQFAYDDALDTDLNLFPNKDVVFFPEIVSDPDGRPSFAMLHRPMWDFGFVRPEEQPPLPAGVTDARASIWISYIPVDEAVRDLTALTRPAGHRFVAGPEYDWEALKIGAGPAPLRVPEGWLLLHHGVTGDLPGGSFVPQAFTVRYVVGAMLLDADDPSRVLARTSEPLMTPETADETAGTVANVLFPTAIEKIGGEHFVFYGAADTRISVARLVRTP